MAIKLNTAYSKKLGLPGFSSHAFSASVEVELADMNQAATECARLYGLLQASVDQEIRNTGYIPDEAYGMREGTPRRNPVAVGRAVQAEVAAGLPTRAPTLGHEPLRHLPLVPRAYSFFSSASCRISMPSTWSATIRLSLAFCLGCASPCGQTSGLAMSLRSIPSPAP